MSPSFISPHCMEFIFKWMCVCMCLCSWVWSEYVWKLKLWTFGWNDNRTNTMTHTKKRLLIKCRNKFNFFCSIAVLIVSVDFSFSSACCWLFGNCVDQVKMRKKKTLNASIWMDQRLNIMKTNEMVAHRGYSIFVQGEILCISAHINQPWTIDLARFSISQCWVGYARDFRSYYYMSTILTIRQSSVFKYRRFH